MRVNLSTANGLCSIPSGVVARGTVRVPPSKSLTQRVLTLALLSGKPQVVDDPLVSEDTSLFFAALETLGFSLDWKSNQVTLEPGSNPGSGQIQCGNNGTMLRFLLGALSAIDGRWVLDGSDRLRQRPIGPLVDALSQLGARLTYLDANGYAPIEIQGGSLVGGYAELDARLSSQFASSVLMAAARARKEVELRLSGLSSAPYLELTMDLVAEFGVPVLQSEPYLYCVKPADLSAGTYRVEGDFSAAAYPAAAALLTDGSVKVEGLSSDSKQGDRRFLDILREMGAVVEWGPDSVLVSGSGSITAVMADLSDLPDQGPTLAALAPFARGTTEITNVAQMRIKESDRLAVMSRELCKLGAEVEEHPDGLTIPGVWGVTPPPKREIQIDPQNDHRVAMSLAICGLRRPGVMVQSPEVVRKSYPDFWLDLEGLLSD